MSYSGEYRLRSFGVLPLSYIFMIVAGLKVQGVIEPRVYEFGTVKSGHSKPMDGTVGKMAKRKKAIKAMAMPLKISQKGIDIAPAVAIFLVLKQLLSG